jgi:hypothetical protein
MRTPAAAQAQSTAPALSKRARRAGSTDWRARSPTTPPEDMFLGRRFHHSAARLRRSIFKTPSAFELKGIGFESVTVVPALRFQGLRKQRVLRATSTKRFIRSSRESRRGTSARQAWSSTSSTLAVWISFSVIAARAGPHHVVHSLTSFCRGTGLPS